ncbi:unnamed protein product [Paramecium primaurelia]|uniref:Uncharacterized protein n=1 Tax=Paramecium primaurelia TaxID=5886 RepID=A0A8S1M802_PARPR|nr:unnamed protein product [Paramecium primaurelia]
MQAVKIMIALIPLIQHYKFYVIQEFLERHTLIFQEPATIQQ